MARKTFPLTDPALDHVNDRQVGQVVLRQRDGALQSGFVCIPGFDHAKNILESLHVIHLLQKV